MKKNDSIPLHELPDLPFMASDKPFVFGDPAENHRINFYAIIWFLEDKGQHFIDFKSYPVRKNCIYLLAENQVHSIPAPVLPCARVIVFPADFFHQIEDLQLRQLFLPFEEGGFQVPPEMVLPMEQLFKLLLLEYRGKAESQMLLQYTTLLLRHLFRFGKDRLPAVAGEDSRMVKLFQLIGENYKENRSTAFYATQIGLTPKRINEILRKTAGITMSQLLYQLLLLESKRELFHGVLSIKEIAYNLGFSDQSYFARFFKKHTRISPEKFREKAAIRQRQRES
ncbi:MAG: helix-turn-helix domain-containing protein [Chitinophagaceae bacterium]|nr:MAG: helix-turn-helix domain-containing protein [Chitinophagaceae bacterium]